MRRSFCGKFRLSGAAFLGPVICGVRNMKTHQNIVSILVILILSGCATLQGDRRVISAVEDQDILRLKELIAEGAELNPQCGYFIICQPLAIASERGYLRIMGLLIDSGSDLNGRNSYGDTPLILALTAKQRGAVKLLVDSGADVNHPNDFGMSPFIGVCAKGDTDFMHYFLRRGADVNASFKNRTTGKTIPDNKTALMYAVVYRRREVVKALLDSGANLNAIDSSRMTAMKYAEKNGDKAILDLLSSN